MKTTCYQTCPVAPSSLPRFKRDRLKTEHVYHQKAVEKVRQESQRMGLAMTFIEDQNLSHAICGKYDLILTLGGDGTFLTTAQYCGNTPILGINSHPVKQGSRGALLTTSVANFTSLCQRLKQGTLGLERWPRLVATLDGKKLNSNAVNEVFFGPAEQDKTIEFLVKVGTVRQVVLSSGAIISTPRGSTGWYANAGGTPFEKALGIGVLVREPNPTHALRFMEKVVSASSTTRIEWGGQGGFISFDSRREARYSTDSDHHTLLIRLSMKEGLWVVRV